MEKIFAVAGILIAIGAAYLLSNNKEEVNWKSVITSVIAQLVLAFLLIVTPLWKVVELLSNATTWIIGQASSGINFVFGGLVPEGGFVFFIGSLLPIVFISALIGLLFHFGVIQKFISLVSKTLSKKLDVNGIVVTNSVANMLFGQSESLFVTKSQLPTASDEVIFATLVGGMTSISASVVGLYMGYGASVEWILISMPLTVLASFTFTQILMPTKYEGEDIVVEADDKGINAIETMMNYANAGFKGVIGITVALIVFLSMVGLINGLLGMLPGNITLEGILSFIFYPISLLTGVPFSEVAEVSTILGTKFVTNEAVAIALPEFAILSEKAKAMMTIALMGFAGIGSIGILVGGYTAVAPNKVQVVARLGFKALICATVVNVFSAAVVGLFL